MPRAVVAISVVLLACGTAFAAAGILLDARGWWEDKPFLTNLLSSLTSAMFGIPIALVLLSGLNRATLNRGAVAAVDARLRELLLEHDDLFAGLRDPEAATTLSLATARITPRRPPTAWLIENWNALNERRPGWARVVANLDRIELQFDRREEAGSPVPHALRQRVVDLRHCIRLVREGGLVHLDEADSVDRTSEVSAAATLLLLIVKESAAVASETRALLSDRR